MERGLSPVGGYGRGRSSTGSGICSEQRANKLGWPGADYRRDLGWSWRSARPVFAFHSAPSARPTAGAREVSEGAKTGFCCQWTAGCPAVRCSASCGMPLLLDMTIARRRQGSDVAIGVGRLFSVDPHGAGLCHHRFAWLTSQARMLSSGCRASCTGQAFNRLSHGPYPNVRP